MASDKLSRVWGQSSIPVVMRSNERGAKLRVKLPYDLTNRAWLGRLGRIKPIYFTDSKQWELPNAWFNDFVNKSLARFGNLYVIQPFREQENCASACMNAAGHDCQCSCMGANHGAGNDGSWFEVSETFATRWGEREIACRLMIAKRATGI